MTLIRQPLRQLNSKWHTRNMLCKKKKIQIKGWFLWSRFSLVSANPTDTPLNIMSKKELVHDCDAKALKTKLSFISTVLQISSTTEEILINKILIAKWESICFPEYKAFTSCVRGFQSALNTVYSVCSLAFGYLMLIVVWIIFCLDQFLLTLQS